MIWRLTYCNKEGVEARIDIIRGNRTPVEIVQGSGQPFTLAYKLDKNDKSGHIMTSSADIEIFETETFNIDDLKTSNETELKVEYFEDNVLSWEGFILPDFFSREIGSPNIVRMTASDRLTALKGVTLSDLPSRISLRNLIELSLSQTGLNLGLVSQIQINQGSTNILDSEILSQRLIDVRGRSISCYDILMSIMVGTNSTIRQRKGQWQVYNKLEHELRTPTIFFDKVERGAIRTIQPVASSVGVYQEHGGGLNYPSNYDFSDNLNGWSAINGFTASIDNRQVSQYSYSGGNYTPSYGEVGDSNYVVNRYNNLFADASSPYLKSSIIGVIYPTEKTFNVEVEINATNAMLAATSTVVDFAIIIEGNGNTLSMDGSGLFNEVVGGKPFIHRMLFPKAMPIGGGFINKAATASKKVKGLAISPDENFEGYTAHIRIYGSGGSYQSLIHSATLTFSSTNDVPKGNIFKTTQGSNFTKLHDAETTVFGDYITSGLNGYFYHYPIDDTSNLYLPNGELSSPAWKTVFDTTERPLLHHVSRQKSSLFSVAHDILKANINVDSFDPLAVFQDCKGGKYVVVSASFDFLRSEVNVELEQIAYDNTILKRDFIYSYFGEGEDTIKSIGGISGGGGGGGAGGGDGGGMTNDQIAILNDVAKLSHLHENKEIIDQITQDMLDNASRELVTSTDTQTELTDENILSSLRTLLEISNANEDLLEEISRKFLRKDIEDTALEKITFLKGIIASDLSTFTDLIASGKIIAEDIEVKGESLFHGLAKFLKGIIASDLSTFTDLIASGKIIAEDIDVKNHLLTNTLKVILQADLQTILLRGQMNSETFASGMLGHGMRLRKNGEDWELELDKITVRKAMTVYELIVQEIRYQGGQHIYGPAGAKLTKVTDEGSHWRCEHDGTMDFITGAQVLCQRFEVGSKAENPDGLQTYKDTRIKRYWRLVTSYGSGWFNLSKLDCEIGSDVPETDDQVAVLGHRTNPDWQNAIMLVSTGSDAPYTAYYAGINSYSTVGKEVIREGNLNGIVDAQFGQLRGHGLYAENVYLKGQFRLNNNKLIEDAINEANRQEYIGALNLLREYDARFDFKYWGEDGEKVEVDFNEITPYTVMILCDRDNVIVTEDNLAIKIIL